MILTFSMAISFTALSTMFLTSSSTRWSCNSKRSPRVVPSPITNLTWGRKVMHNNRECDQISDQDNWVHWTVLAITGQDLSWQDSGMKVEYMETRLKKNYRIVYSAERDHWWNIIEWDGMRHCEVAAQIVSYPCGVHKLLPVSFSDSRVLQLVDGSQRGQQVLHSRLQTHVDVPHPHLLIQHLHLL